MRVPVWIGACLKVGIEQSGQELRGRETVGRVRSRLNRVGKKSATNHIIIIVG